MTCEIYVIIICDNYVSLHASTLHNLCVYIEINVATCEIYVIICVIYVTLCEIIVATCEMYVIACEMYVIACEVEQNFPCKKTTGLCRQV